MNSPFAADLTLATPAKTFDIFSVTIQLKYAWYSIRTKSRFEKSVAASLEAKGYPVLLPLYREARRWCGRNCEVELPLFSGYLFAQFDPQLRLPILQTPGVVQLVGTCNGPLPIENTEIEGIRRIVRIGIQAKPSPFLISGDIVEVSSGPLMGLRGFFIRQKNEHRLILSVSLLQRAIGVEVDCGSVKRISVRPPGTETFSPGKTMMVA